MLDVLVICLKMSPATVLTRQISLMMLGWAHEKEYCYVAFFYDLESNLRAYRRVEVERLDMELYGRCLKIGLEEKGYLEILIEDKIDIGFLY